MSRDELAHALRPVLRYKEHEYILEGPAYKLCAPGAFVLTRAPLREAEP
ncbi:hypothetical protein [Sorangium sp. So ce233]